MAVTEIALKYKNLNNISVGINSVQNEERTSSADNNLMCC